MADGNSIKIDYSAGLTAAAHAGMEEPLSVTLTARQWIALLRGSEFFTTFLGHDLMDGKDAPEIDNVSVLTTAIAAQYRITAALVARGMMEESVLAGFDEALGRASS